jgi:outer membrane receptor protein involved in Fe transport
MSKKSNWGRILLSGASLAAMGAFTPAFAQDAEEVTDEIVVTATGRAAAIQDVPLAVTAVGGETLENTGANDLRDVVQVAPSLSMGTGQSNSSGTTARIRGIGTGSDNPGFEAAVGIFIDGVYRARAGAALADLPELERVEILRGPQGTLFGRNTSAGAISVVTAGPDYDPGMYVEASVAFDDYEEGAMRAGVNLPVTDNLAFRLDGTIRDRFGYITDLISGDDINDRSRWTARGQMQLDIGSDATLRVIVDGAETDEVCCGITPLFYGAAQGGIHAVVNSLVGLGAFPGVPLNGATPAINVNGRGMTVTPQTFGLPALGPGLPAQPGGPARNYGEETKEQGISAQLDWDIGGVNLTSITALRDWKADRNQDIDFNVIDIAYRDGLHVGFENFTQEFRLQGETGILNWLVGVFYGDETLETNDTIRVGAHSNLFANAVSRGSTISALTPNGCEYYDSTAGDVDGVSDPIPSLFMCLGGAPFANAYLTGNTSGQGQQSDSWQVDTESLSLFTHNEISISDALVLTAGLRYNTETKELTSTLLSTSTSCLTLQGLEAFSAPLVPGPGGIVNALNQTAAAGLMNIACNPAINPISNGTRTGESEEEEFSGTVSLAYHLNEDTMLYGGYSRGYKAGGFNVDRSGFQVTPATIDPTTIAVSQLAFDPEFTDAFELGLKSTVLGGTTTLNIAAFYQQITDYQLNAFNGFNFITRNIPDAVSQGAEIEFTSRPAEGLTLSGGVVYTDAFYDSTVNFLAPRVDLSGQDTVVAGQPFAFSPEWVVTGGIAYEAPLGNNLRALFYLDGRWNSEYRTQTLNRHPGGLTDNEAFAIFNGRIGIGPESERWSVELWGRNITDETYYVGAFVPPLQSNPNPASQTYVVYPNEPATYGVSVRLQY